MSLKAHKYWGNCLGLLPLITLVVASAKAHRISYDSKKFNRQTTGAVFTTFYFLCNLRVSPKLHYSRVEMLVRDKYSSLLDPYVSYAKKKML